MSDSFSAYFARLEQLSSEDLDRSVAELVLAEKLHVAQVIAHIAEISRRTGLQRTHVRKYLRLHGLREPRG